MEKIVLLNKEICETPLECIERWKAKNPEYKDVKTAYAGRLDPLAEGLLLIMVGEECKNREYYQNLSKVYEFDVLLGVSTDTYDTLGLVKQASQRHMAEILPLPELPRRLTNVLIEVKKIKYQQYPPFSSFHVAGKPLWQWTKEGKLESIDIPSKEVEIQDLKIGRIYEISKKNLLFEVKERARKVKGNFRQDEIVKSWIDNLVESPNDYFPLISFEITVSSGVYVRSIANEIGQIMDEDLPSLAYRIRRTKVGEWGMSGE